MKRNISILLLSISFLSASAFAQPQSADYGDAPDGTFPTRFITLSSRVGEPGAHHLVTTEAWLGPMTSVTSREEGAVDLADPDGLGNLPGGTGSDGDAWDDGLLSVFATPSIPTQINASINTQATPLTGVVRVSVAKGAADAVRYLNVLVDVDRNGEWRNLKGIEEWTTMNMELDVSPETTRVFNVNLGFHREVEDVWVRLTLTDEPIDQAKFAELGGWDGSGRFQSGETEDHLITADRFQPPPSSPPPDEPEWEACSFWAFCEADPLVLPHGTTGDLVIRTWVYDPYDIGCDVYLTKISEDTVGPLKGSGVQNGAEGSFPDIQDVQLDPEISFPLLNPGMYLSRYHVPVGGAGDPPPRIQSFGVRAKVVGAVAGFFPVYRSSITCGVLVNHDWPTITTTGSGGIPLPVKNNHGIGSNDLNFFATVSAPVQGSMQVTRVNDRLPNLSPKAESILPRYWILSHHLSDYGSDAFSSTRFHNIFFQTDDILLASGLNWENLKAGRWKPGNFGDHFFDVLRKQQPFASGSNVEDPDGFSIWVVGEDNNDNGLFDFQEKTEEELYFAQFGDGEGLLFSQIMLLNPDDDKDAGARILLRDPLGQPLIVDLNGQEVPGMLETVVPAGGMKVLKTDGVGPLVTGSVTVVSDRPLAGVILFGGAVGVAGVGSSVPLTAGFAAPMENMVAQSIRVGIALMNVETFEVSANLQLYDAEGNLVATLPNLSIPAKGREAKFLDELFLPETFPGLDLSSFEGLLRVTADGTVAATVIQTRPGEFVTMPVTPIGDGTETLYFAQFGDGSGNLFSEIMLFGMDDNSAADAQVLLKDPDGKPLTVDLNGQVVAGVLDVSIPARGIRVLRTDGVGQLATGSVTVTASQPISGVILFGGIVGAAGVGNSPPQSTAFLAPMENNTAKAIRVGIALMNVGAFEVSATLQLYDAEGTLAATLSNFMIPAGGRAASFLDELFPAIDLSDWTGVLKVTATGTTAATVIQTRPGKFATMPVAPQAP